MRRNLFVILVVLMALSANYNFTFSFTEQEITLHDEYYKEGSDLIAPYIYSNKQSPELNARIKESVNRGINLLKKAIRINPDNWSAYWIIGKGYQALDEHSKAYEFLGKAYKINFEDTAVAREYMIECITIGNFNKAVSVGRRAIELDPADAGLKANLAVALLLDGSLDEAERIISESLESDPADKITKRLAGIIKDVKSGKLEQPKAVTDIESYIPSKDTPVISYAMSFLLIGVILVMLGLKFLKTNR